MPRRRVRIRMITRIETPPPNEAFPEEKTSVSAESPVLVRQPLPLPLPAGDWDDEPTLVNDLPVVLGAPEDDVEELAGPTLEAAILSAMDVGTERAA